MLLCFDQLNYNLREIRDLLVEILILFLLSMYVSGISKGYGGSIILWWIDKLLGRAGFEPTSIYAYYAIQQDVGFNPSCPHLKNCCIY